MAGGRAGRARPGRCSTRSAACSAWTRRPTGTRCRWRGSCRRRRERDRTPIVVGEATRALVDGWATTPAAVLDERFDVLAANRAYRLVWGDPDAAPAGWRNALLLLAAPHVGGGPYRVVAEEPLLRGLYEQFRADTAHWPDDGRAAEIVALLTKERPDAAHWWECRAVQDFAPITAAVEGARAGLRLTFSLLRPVAEHGLYVFAHTPADERSREALAALIG
ncbi:hypothetical protein GCM10020219_034960 [Nonomuraea dietziae]